MIPDLASLDAAGLIEKLGDPNLTVRILATHELVERVGKDSASAVHAFLAKIAPATNEPESGTVWGVRKPAVLPQDSATTEPAIPPTPGSSIVGPPDKYFAEKATALRDSERMKLSPNQLTQQELRPTGDPASHGLWALERLGELDSATLWRAAGADFAGATLWLAKPAPGARVTAAQLLGERSQLSSVHRQFLQAALRGKSLHAQRAATAALARHVGSVGTSTARDLASRIDRVVGHDFAALYALRMGLRDAMRAPDGFGGASSLLERPSIAEHFADASLAVPTPGAADFLLTHLQRTKLAAPRTGEFLKHVSLHLPAERLGELAALVETIKDAPLPQRLEVADNLSQAIRQRGAKLPEALAAWTQRVMIDALGTPDDGLLKRAIESVRESKSDEKYEPLVRVIEDPKRHGPLRAAALEAVANIDLGPAALAGALADPSSMTLRKKAAELLGQSVANPNVEHTLLAALPSAPWELATSIAAGLAKTDASSAALLTLIESGKASPSLLRNKTVAAALSQRPTASKERAAALTKDLPPEDARLDGVIAARVAEFRAAKPDAKHGEQVFQQACAACHKVKNVGGNLAPNLDAAAARGLHRLLEDILDPNRNVDPAFAQVVIETNDGQLFAGVGPRAEGELIVMSDAAGKPVSVPKAQIKTQTQSRLSLMPPTFETTLSGQDLNDLVAYLNAQTDAPTRSAN